MTNKEKFKEVFGLEIDDTSDCGFFDCTDRPTCEDCPVKDTKAWWNTEYHIKILPSVTPQEPRKAIWIERSDIPRGCGEYLCSNCMDEYGTDLLYSYCPNCGAYHGKNKEIIKEEDFGKCDMKMINRGKCILCGKKLAEGLLFFCKECNK